ncbi:CoA transferase [Georgenia sp. AZ-5]|uniref:CoA transferase n=1 Tax=Georgenia sp. AZ-5 TaxID=3367526 RepID=UPI0037544F21
MEKFSAARRLRVVDLTTGMGGALAARLLADAGATVHRVAPAGDEVMARLYPAYRSWHATSVTAGSEELDELLAAADVVLTGGEDHPEVSTRRDAEQISAHHPRLVVVDLPGYVSEAHDGAPAVDSLVQARTGMGTEHFSDRPLHFAVPMPTFGQAMLAALGAWAGLIERLHSHTGQVVTASLEQGAALFMMPFWMSAEHPDPEFDKVTPKDVEHLLFRCKDGTYVQFVMGVPSAVKKLYGILGIDVEVDPADRGFPKPGAPADQFFGNRPLIGAHVAKMNRADILTAAAEVGIPAAPVLEPGQFWDDEQLAANGILTEAAGATAVANVLGVLGTAPAPGWPCTTTAATAPLAGIKVLDLGAFVAGPFTSRFLGDLGAEVIKVDTLQGDVSRGTLRHFLACHSGKRDLAIDLKSEDGARVLADLLKDTDIVTHNFRRGVDRRLGVSPEQLRAHRPDLITLQSLAFGPTGPRADDPGFDMVVQALVGLERRAGGPSRPPVWYRTPYLDYATGTLGAIAVLMALYEREVDGVASDVWVSLLNAGMFMISDMVRLPDGTLAGPRPLEADGLGTHPTERYYRTADGWIAIAARSDSIARNLWRELTGMEPGRPVEQWAADETAHLASALEARTTEAALADVRRCGAWAEPWQSPVVPETSRQDDVYGEVRGHLGPMITFSRTRLPERGRPGIPAHGQHTREVLAELGYDDQAIDALYAAGTVC